MTDKNVERITRDDGRMYYPGVDKPEQKTGYGPPRPIRGSDPTKDPEEISGWEMFPLTGDESDEPPFLIPTNMEDHEIPPQSDFFKRLDDSKKDKK